MDGIGAKLTKDWGGAEEAKTKLPAYLRKETKNSEGRKHKKGAKIDDAAMGPLIDWMLTL